MNKIIKDVNIDNNKLFFKDKIIKFFLNAKDPELSNKSFCFLDYDKEHTVSRGCLHIHCIWSYL